MKVTLPSDYSEITIAQYQKVWKVYEKESNAHQAVRRTIECLGNLTEGTLEQAQWKDIESAAEKIHWFLSEPDASLLRTELQNQVTLNNKQYGFIPNWSTLTVGEFADLETYCNQGMFENLHIIMSIVYRPIALTRHDSYEIERYVPSKERKQLMLNLPMDVAIGALVFFCNIEKELVSITQPYSKQKEQMNQQKQLVLNGDGMLPSMN